MSTEDYSLLNKKLDSTSSFWKKKYTLLLKRTENVEKQNLRIINRLYQVKKTYKHLSKERRFLMKRLDKHGDDYRSVKFFTNTETLVEGTSQYNKPELNSRKPTQAAVKPKKIGKSCSPGKTQKNGAPKKPLNAFLRFCQAQRDVVMQEHPGMSNQDLTKTLSKNWNVMKESDKEVYYNMFDEDRIRYDREMEFYKMKQEKKETEESTNHADVPPSLSILAEKSQVVHEDINREKEQMDVH